MGEQTPEITHVPDLLGNPARSIANAGGEESRKYLDQPEITHITAMYEDERAAKKIAADAADRFRDVLSECLGYEDENPGDDVLVGDLRAHFGKAGPEPTRWRDFLTGALAVVDQINADRMSTPPAPSLPEYDQHDHPQDCGGECG